MYHDRNLDMQELDKRVKNKALAQGKLDFENTKGD